MKTNQTSSYKLRNVRNKTVKGWRRFSVFANATALAVVSGNAFKTVVPEIQKSNYTAWTVVLTVSAVLIALTAAVVYIKFFTDEDN